MQAFCQCHAFTTQSHFFYFISKKISLINIGPSIWFLHRFLISGQSSTTLFSVYDNCQKVDENCTLTVHTMGYQEMKKITFLDEPFLRKSILKFYVVNLIHSNFAFSNILSFFPFLTLMEESELKSPLITMKALLSGCFTVRRHKWTKSNRCGPH